jgi:type II secretory pathway pseudopilin PulG
MRSQERNAFRRKHRQGGFSLLEMMTVVAITFIVTVVSVMTLIPMLKQQRLTNAYNTALSAMRQARDKSVAQKTSYSVTFSSTAVPNTIVVAPTYTGFTGVESTQTYQLPSDVNFLAQTGLPATGPDGYGTGMTAIDFGYTATGGAGGVATVYFCPDGSAQIASTCGGSLSWDGGVVYIARSGDLLSSRALTLWGGTGRIRGWRLYANTSGGYQWLRQ